MTIELTEPQRAILLDLLESSHKGKLHELHHTATLAYKEELRRQIELIEALERALAGAGTGAARG
jgi:hypothetical protein